MTLTMMTHAEVVEFDHDVLADICLEHGTCAEQVIAETLTEVEHLLSLAALQVNGREVSGLSRTCQDLRHLAAQIGMRTLDRAAAAVQQCIDAGDAIALAACASRMVRLGKPEAIDHWTVRHNTVA